MKKVYLFLILAIIVVSSLFIVRVEAATNPYVEKSMYGTNCTWYVWDQVYRKKGIALPGWGNAKNWYRDAEKSGYEVGTTPRANSIVVWGGWTDYGHVGYVERVDGNILYTWDSAGGCIDQEDEEFKSCLAQSVNEETESACYKKAKPIACQRTVERYKPTGFIYLDNVPTKSSTTSNGSTTTNNSQSEKKSSNAYLSKLSISDVDIAFNKNTFNYEVEVKGEINTIKIEGSLEDKNAKVDGLGEKNLEFGINKIDVVVTAADGSKKTYTIVIKRLDNNTYLEELMVSGVDIDFDKDVQEYTFKVENEVDQVKVEAKAQSEVASVQGLGEYELSVGLNKISLIVTAEDMSQRIYDITIERVDSSVDEDVIAGDSQIKKDNKWVIYLIAGSVSVFIIGFVEIVLFKKSRKTK